MSFRAWRAWVRSLPWSLRWFVCLVLLRPALDPLYFLKDVSPFLSPLYIVGVLTPVAVVASFFSPSFPRAPKSHLDVLMGGWGWFLLLGSYAALLLTPSLSGLEVAFKISLPVFLYFYCRHLIQTRQDLLGVLTTFLYSTVVPLGMLLYERFVSPLGDLVLTREYERYGGLYADVVSYALYAMGALVVACYFFLALPPPARFAVHARRLLVVSPLAVLAFVSIHHAASYAVAGMVVLLLLAFSVGRGRFSVLLLVVFVVGAGALLVGDTVAERVGVMFRTDLMVLSGEKPAGAAFHGRMTRWEVYLDYWGEMPAVAKLFGVALNGVSSATLNAMMLGGIHSDYLRIAFASGLVGLAVYLAFLGCVVAKSFRAALSERFLIWAVVAVILMYSVTTLPTLYAPLMYLCLPVLAYAALPRRTLMEGGQVPARRAAPGAVPGAVSGAPTGGRPRPVRRSAVARTVVASRPVGGNAPQGEGARPSSSGPPAQAYNARRGDLPGGRALPVPPPLASSPERIEAALDEVLSRGIVDWIMASEVAAVVRGYGADTDAEVRASSLKVIEGALRQGLVRAGDMTAEGFKVWPGGVTEHMARVEKRWPEGLDIYLHDVCWLDLTSSGFARGRAVERRYTAVAPELTSRSS